MGLSDEPGGLAVITSSGIVISSPDDEGGLAVITSSGIVMSPDDSGVPTEMTSSGMTIGLSDEPGGLPVITSSGIVISPSDDSGEPRQRPGNETLLARLTHHECCGHHTNVAAQS